MKLIYYLKISKNSVHMNYLINSGIYNGVLLLNDTANRTAPKFRPLYLKTANRTAKILLPILAGYGSRSYTKKRTVKIKDSVRF
jgi:hypothetical protein